jgi:hypothetical protein
VPHAGLIFQRICKFRHGLDDVDLLGDMEEQSFGDSANPA